MKKPETKGEDSHTKPVQIRQAAKQGSGVPQTFPVWDNFLLKMWQWLALERNTGSKLVTTTSQAAD